MEHGIFFYGALECGYERVSFLSWGDYFKFCLRKFEFKVTQ